MITCIEIDGFKSFRNFKLDLHPFQVIIGANGVGKSNLFDAIMLLSQLAEGRKLGDVLRNGRGEVFEQFAQDADGNYAQSMRFAVEMLIPKRFTSALGGIATVDETRLRYELVIERQTAGNFERLSIREESLKAIERKTDTWLEHHLKDDNAWLVEQQRDIFFLTESELYVIDPNNEASAGNRQEFTKNNPTQTFISIVSQMQDATIIAVRQEMLSWRLLHFNPEKLRSPSNTFDTSDSLLRDGSNLAAVIHRIMQDDTFSSVDISRDMMNIVPGIVQIQSELLKETNQILIRAKTIDNNVFSSRVLSDGTLRLLALVAMRNDPQYHGVLCFEEPENGVHPQRLDAMIDVLTSLATDFQSDEDLTLRQVIINTHSPVLMTHVKTSDLMYMYMPRHDPRITRISMVSDGNISISEKQFTIAQISDYLNPRPYVQKQAEVEDIS